MQKRKLGNSDLYITPIGLGTWSIGGGGWSGGWGPQSDDVSIATIHRALDLGINWIDAAPYYGLGHSEELVGRAVAGRREQVIIASKCGLVWEPGTTTVTRRLKADSVRREIEISLKRLNTDYLDICHVHWPTESEEETAEGWSTIADLIREGKVRCGGASNFTLAQHQQAHNAHPITASQPSYNLILRGAEADVLPYCAANNIGVIVARPLLGGLLAGKFTQERAANLPDDDWRKRRDWFQEPKLSATLALVEGLRPIAARHGKTIAQLAIAWILQRSEVTGVIAGARHPSQIEEDVAAWDCRLSGEDLTEIDALVGKWERRLMQK